MRLIDADKLKEKKEYSEERHEYIVSVAQIDWQPTIEQQGIDKDRLIEELDKLIEPVEHLDIKTKLAYNKGVMDAQVVVNQQPQPYKENEE